MTTRSERDRQKALQEKHQNLLTQLLKDEDNKYCVDCDAKGPRWASWNLGIFLCIRCAGIHRNLGVHISKVKSVNLDSWTPEQIAMMQEMGNSRARAVYEANIPDSFRRPQTDSGLEAFIRSKYEHKKYIAHEWVPPQPKVQNDVEIVTEKKPVPNPKKSPIFEEMPKKEKKKPKTKQEGFHISTPPTVSNASSKPQTNSKSETEEPVATSRPRKAAAVDLLGLDEPAASAPASSSTSGDLFGEFMSTPVTSTTTSNPTVQTTHQPSSQTELMPTLLQNGDASQPHSSTVVENGEASLLGDSSAAGSDQKKSKESILALYGNAATSQPQNMYGMAGNMYMGGGGGVAQQPPQQIDMAHNQQMYLGAMMQQQQQPAAMQQQPGMMNMQQMGMHQQYPNSVMYVEPATEMQMAYTNYQQQGMPVWNANMQSQYAQGTGGMMSGMGGMNTGMPQNMMMSNQAMYNTNMYSQGQQMGQLQNQMSGMNLGMSSQSMGGYQQPAAMATAGGGGMGWGVPQTGNTLATNLWQ